MPAWLLCPPDIILLAVWMMLELMELMVETCSLVCSLEERLELALLLADTVELRAPYELSDSVPEAIKLVVEMVFLPCPELRENLGAPAPLASCS